MKLDKESFDLVAKRKEELKKIIPEAFTEGKLDANKLRQALGDVVPPPATPASTRLRSGKGEIT